MTAGQGRNCYRHGFTLLEVLIATALSVTVLSLLWALFSVYLGLFDKASAQTEQVQLARALLGQLDADLRSAIEDSPDEDPAAAAPDVAGRTTAVRRFGLLGTRHTLRFDVLQVVPLEESPSLQGDVADALRGVKVRQVPELRTVFYTFRKADVFENADPAAADEEDLVARPGLTRRELDYETPYTEIEDSMAGRRPPATVASSVDSAGGPAASDPFAEDLADPEQVDDSITWVPEVAGLEFRYFDGSGFSSEWNSLTRKSLPAAIEVTMQLRPPDQPGMGRPVTGERDTDKLNFDELEPDLEELLDDVETGRSSPERVETTVFSLLIDLPSAKHRSGIKRPARVAAMPAEFAGPLVPAPLAVPGPLRIGRPDRNSTAARESDQWIRTGP